MRFSRDRMADWEKVLGGKRLPELVPGRDYSNLNRQDAQLRVWLPESARQALDALCDREDTSMTVYLTEMFICYLFGIHELIRLRENRLGPYEPEPITRKYNRQMAAAALPELGKNIFPLKIFVPSKLKDALQGVASDAGVSLGVFVRGLICAHLFGRDYGMLAPIDWSRQEQDMAERWERASEDEN